MIKLFWRCNSEKCNKLFKISETTAIQLMHTHKNPPCPYCSSEFTTPAMKTEYKKASGQLVRHMETEAKPLSEFCKGV